MTEALPAEQHACPDCGARFYGTDDRMCPTCHANARDQNPLRDADHCPVCEMPDGDHLDWCTPQARLNAKYDPMSRDDLIAECERLERERAEWASIAATRNLNIVLIAEEKDAEQLKRRQAEHELDAALAKLQELDVLLRRTTPYLHGTELRDQIHAALPDTRG